MTWVKFHEELCSGAKRGLPRATRFILMELSLKARRGRGELRLPLGMSDVDGLHDLLGGNRKEIVVALNALTDGDDAPLRLEGESGARRLVIPSWSRWNAVEAGKASTERSRRYRATVVQRDATIVADECNGEATVVQREGNGRATVPRGEESRSEEKREEGSPKPPRRTKQPKPAPLPVVAFPPDWVPKPDHFAWARNSDAVAFPEHVVDAEADEFRDKALAKGTMHADWDAAFRTWLRNARRFHPELPRALPIPEGGPPPLPPVRPEIAEAAAQLSLDPTPHDYLDPLKKFGLLGQE